MADSYKVGNLIYDGDIYDGMNTGLEDLPFYKRWMPKRKDAQILELCCGTGRLTLPIAVDGHSISGVDSSLSMIERARAKAHDEGLEIDFIKGDMRFLDIPRKFDLIFIPFNSIHHLYTNEDFFMTLQVVRRHLKEGGVFLFDCFNPNIRFIVDGEKQKRVVADYTTKDGRDVLIKETMHYEYVSQINRIVWQFFINGVFDSTQNLDMRMFFPQELDTYLKWNGFEIIHKFGSFDEEVFGNDSVKQIFVCQPAAS